MKKLLCIFCVLLMTLCIGCKSDKKEVKHDDLSDPEVIESLTPDPDIIQPEEGVVLSENDAVALLKQKLGKKTDKANYIYKIRKTLTIDQTEYYYGDWIEKDKKTGKKDTWHFFLKTDGTKFIVADLNKKGNGMKNKTIEQEF